MHRGWFDVNFRKVAKGCSGLGWVFCFLSPDQANSFYDGEREAYLVSPCMDVYMRFTSLWIFLTPPFSFFPVIGTLVRLCRHDGESPLGRMTDPTDACLPATYSHSNSRRDGWVPAFIRMLSSTMTLDEGVCHEVGVVVS